MEDEASLEVRVRGIVQGVGFRPFVHRLASRMGLEGWVRNDAGSVTIRVEGRRPSLDAFLQALTAEAPPLARIDAVEIAEIAPERSPGFRVIPSEADGEGSLPVPPDVAVCPRCLEELQDPADRRHRYPFITCTDCGPRFTVIEGMPYDRERTSMTHFPQCPQCLVEYGSPEDRRYHSETNSCPACGPRIWFERNPPSGGSGEKPHGDVSKRAPGGCVSESAAKCGGGVSARGRGSWVVEGTDAALSAGVAVIRNGGVLALRGLGGFHLAVDARNEEAVARLRARKGREEKPLAIMVGGVAEAREIVRVGEDEERLLGSPECPIVLLRKRPGARLAASLSPGLDTVGVMLPYTPLHHLLLEAAGGPLVMTSGNSTDEPLATGNQEARERLGRMADGFLLHDREILARQDDSVVRIAGGGAVFLRRARGYAPVPLSLPVPSPVPLLAVGPHLKSTFALVSGGTAFVSQHLGDLESVETLDHFHDTLARFQRLFRIHPEVVVRDLHPGYLSTRLAKELAEDWGCESAMPVQHHHAHVAAVLAEHGESGPVVGVSFDGSGYGEDGRVWGAEILDADLVSFRRMGHLRYAPLPGGETAVRNPWRTAAGYLSLEPEREGDFELAFRGVSDRERDTVGVQARRRVNAPLASSMGRLFDAAAAVLGLRGRCAYEGQAAMEMEALASGDPQGAAVGRAILPFPWAREPSGFLVMDPLPLLAALGESRQAGEEAERLALSFHQAVIRTTREMVMEVCRVTGRDTVALGGGVFQNAILLEGLAWTLEDAGLRVLVPGLLSPNDGAISYGQAAVAAARLAGGQEVPPSRVRAHRSADSSISEALKGGR